MESRKYESFIIGIDICGEYNNSMDKLSYEAINKNNKVNKELLDFIYG